MQGLSLFCPAKINLGLAVLGRREDGFHDIETYLACIALGDTLFMAPAPEFSLRLSGAPGVPADRRNLVCRAADLFATRTGLTIELQLQLAKRIPPGSGLGGGSSDAAATLLGLNTIYDEPLEQEELHELAARLGSDVPFFLRGGVALATGRGEVLESKPAPADQHLVLALPQAAVSTAWAYMQITAEDLRPLEREAIEGWLTGGPRPRKLPNAFARPVGATFPVIERSLQLLQQAGLDAVSLTGSGAACFGLAEDGDSAARIAREIESRGIAAVPTRIRDGGVTLKKA
jgi:4-diphosphocytidyl-2-C-methyl-D-erythritol kinase